MKRHLLPIIAFLLLQSVPTPSHSEDLPLPRFVSIKPEEANIRTGPGKRYQIKYVITKKNMPVEIVREFEQWRKIRDLMGDEGWVHMSMLSGTRYVLVQPSQQVVRKANSASGRPLAKLESGVIAKLKTCDAEWCEIAVNDDLEGWILRSGVWGVYPQESFEK